ncbi:conserved protein of unknown function [Georgfuchsia toluolica]|uniref:ABC-type transport auxiliary lipoprotein component domain-containing protein n=1 Tax=Georgfuchsia toluolica TaxID=424218 RepID=A0A916J0L8_9PROT|nr:ABC-type transport auxiliary lipoprotein family protein [Georgfuchsia toluolica]CAG4882408.1 conserved protein of unknown function [Georgfuchsia toluolica]
MKRIAPHGSLPYLWQFAAAALSLALLSGCGVLSTMGSPAPQPTFYSLAYMPGTVPDAAAPAAPRAAVTALTLIVSPSHAAAGFDSRRIMYLRQANQLEYFAHSEWIDTPARMLTPLIVSAVESSGTFRAVVQTPGAAAGEMRLDTEILRLQHEFLGTPSKVRFTLRAYLVESATRRVIAAREFDAVVSATSEDPSGGVVAASRAVKTVLDDLSAFCADAARSVRMDK